jgi:LacI family transcriptional regulator
MTAPADPSPAGGAKRAALTVKDIARAAEVSPMTVSRVLSGGKNVRPALREHVERVIAELGYYRNQNARSLRTGLHSGLIGVMITNIGNPYYAGMVQGVERVVAATGRRILVGATNEDPGLERQLLADFLGRQVEGLIVVPVGQDPAHLVPEKLRGVPLVLASRTMEGTQADAVLIDDVNGAHDATATMLGEGHRRIAFLGNKVTVSTGQRRLAGFTAAHREHGIPVDDDLVVLGLQDAAAAESAMNDLFGLDAAPTAVFAANNRISIGAIRAITRHTAVERSAGRGAEPLRLFAFDSFEFADMAPIPLSVVDHDPEELGRVCAEMLLARLDGTASPGHPRLIELPVRLVDH